MKECTNSAIKLLAGDLVIKWQRTESSLQLQQSDLQPSGLALPRFQSLNHVSDKSSWPTLLDHHPEVQCINLSGEMVLLEKEKKRLPVN
jgi:hypothetical protein